MDDESYPNSLLVFSSFLQILAFCWNVHYNTLSIAKQLCCEPALHCFLRNVRSCFSYPLAILFIFIWKYVIQPTLSYLKHDIDHTGRFQRLETPMVWGHHHLLYIPLYSGLKKTSPEIENDSDSCLWTSSRKITFSRDKCSMRPACCYICGHEFKRR